jgi:hypothetical protein
MPVQDSSEGESVRLETVLLQSCLGQKQCGLGKETMCARVQVGFFIQLDRNQEKCFVFRVCIVYGAYTVTAAWFDLPYQPPFPPPQGFGWMMRNVKGGCLRIVPVWSLGHEVNGLVTKLACKVILKHG